jgi:cytochrome bd-type quinol oxidase subunit 1
MRRVAWTGKPVYLQLFRFWRRIFAVGFAIGVKAASRGAAKPHATA